LTNVEPGIGAEPWIGMRWTKWLDAEAEVRRSKSRRWESDVAEEMIDGECGE